MVEAGQSDDENRYEDAIAALEELQTSAGNEEDWPEPLDMPEFSMASIDKIVKLTRDSLH